MSDVVHDVGGFGNDTLCLSLDERVEQESLKLGVKTAGCDIIGRVMRLWGEGLAQRIIHGTVRGRSRFSLVPLADHNLPGRRVSAVFFPAVFLSCAVQGIG
jgi:hypothetical protein